MIARIANSAGIEKYLLSQSDSTEIFNSGNHGNVGNRS